MRVGEKADSDFTEEFLLNIPENSSQEDIFRATFMALTPEQQMSALIMLQKLVETKKTLDPIELVTLLEGELAIVMSSIFPNINSRIIFWQKFVVGTTEYKQFQKRDD